MFFKNIFKKKGNKLAGFDLESVIGERCTVTERIVSGSGCGMVRVKGTEWAARGTGEDDCFEVGEALKVVAVEGVRLICRK